MNRALKRFLRHRAAVLSATFLVVVTLLAAAAPWVASHSYDAQNIDARLLAYAPTHPMGTDALGRDLFSRVLHGAQISLIVGIVTAVASLFIGVACGAVAGFYGGWVDLALMALVDTIYIFPSLLLAIILMVLVGQGLGGILLALALTGWVGMARLVRGQVLQAKELAFVEAARAVGGGDGRVLFRHILPNLWGPILVSLTYQIPTNIMAESFLSFLGLGLMPPLSSWGTLAAEGWRAMRSYPHLILYPGVVLFLSLLAFNFVGDGLRDALDPHTRRD